jgi:diguanylate cyclase (GGDEF)-like protein
VIGAVSCAAAGLALLTLLRLRRTDRALWRDSLTGIASRVGFITRCEQLLSRGWPADAAMVTLDIRNLADINEYYGFAVGDALLREVAARLQRHGCSGSIAARTGGDEFAVYLPAPQAPCTRGAPPDCLNRIFATPFHIDGLELVVQADFGCSRLRDVPRPADALLREADLALAHCRANHLAQHWALYEPTLDRQNRERIETTNELRTALTHGEFRLHFQPNVNLRNGRPVAAEALLRWEHPQRGLQSPGRFIPIAEHSGLIIPIGEWVLDEACRQVASWQREGLDTVRISVNVSMVQFIGMDIAARVRELLASHGISPHSIVLEITESVFGSQRKRLLKQLRELSDMGVGLSLDDFGTGYSSLAYLQEYPFNEIKIDQVFVRRMRTDTYSRQIITTVIGLARALNAEVVAEGIEESDTRDLLLDMGCSVGQGYYFSMPLADEDFRWLLQRHPLLPLGTADAASE